MSLLGFLILLAVTIGSGILYIPSFLFLLPIIVGIFALIRILKNKLPQTYSFLINVLFLEPKYVLGMLLVFLVYRYVTYTLINLDGGDYNWNYSNGGFITGSEGYLIETAGFYIGPLFIFFIARLISVVFLGESLRIKTFLIFFLIGPTLGSVAGFLQEPLIEIKENRINRIRTSALVVKCQKNESENTRELLQQAPSSYNYNGAVINRIYIEECHLSSKEKIIISILKFTQKEENQKTEIAITLFDKNNKYPIIRPEIVLTDICGESDIIKIRQSDDATKIVISCSGQEEVFDIQLHKIIKEETPSSPSNNKENEQNISKNASCGHDFNSSEEFRYWLEKIKDIYPDHTILRVVPICSWENGEKIFSYTIVDQKGMPERMLVKYDKNDNYISKTEVLDCGNDDKDEESYFIFESRFSGGKINVICPYKEQLNSTLNCTRFELDTDTLLVKKLQANLY